jgi:di/tricarboxylate transporter
MGQAWVSLAALVLAVALSCTTTINVGVLSLALAFVVGVFVNGLAVEAVLAGFPVPLLVTLVGVTLLFSIAEANGTLGRLTARAVAACRGHAGLLPVMFFAIGFAVATIGAGATPASALLAPPAMAVAARAGVPLLLMAIMAGNGALAGTLSPFAPTGIVANGVMARIGLGGAEWQTFAYNAAAHAVVGFGGFLLLGGWRLFAGAASRAPAYVTGAPAAATQAMAYATGAPAAATQATGGATQAAAAATGASADDGTGAMNRAQRVTTAGIVVLIAGVAGFGLNVGMVAIVVATVLVLLRTVDEAKAIGRMPWHVILMVTGVTVLVTMVEKAGGLELITTAIASVSTPATIAPIAAFGAGIVSIYSSTSGVVLPAFLPMVPDLAQHMGGMTPWPIAWSMSVGASLVDLSSLSTVGALFIAGAPPGSDTRRLFNGLLVWGMAMSIAGAAICWLLFGFR